MSPVKMKQEKSIPNLENNPQIKTMADVITEILNNNLISEILCVCKKTKNSKRYDNIENNPPFQRP